MEDYKALFEMKQKDWLDVCAELSALQADAKVLAETALVAHQDNGDYVIDDYKHPDYETNVERYPCDCVMCQTARRILEVKSGN